MATEPLHDWPSDIDTVLKNYRSGRIAYDFTVSSTSSSVLSMMAENDAGKQLKILVTDYRDDFDIGRQLVSAKEEGYRIVADTARISCSIHQERLDRAKDILIKRIFPNELPSPTDMTDVITACGIAFNRQIDCDTRIFDKPQFQSPDVSKKLVELGLNQGKTRKLYDKYLDLHKYYNASRHFQRQENEKALRRLNSSEGKVICIDFFETTRRFFRWYYRRAVPNWDVLKPIRYRDYHVRYAFRYDRRFPI